MRPAAYKAKQSIYFRPSVGSSSVQPTLSVVENFLQPVMKRLSSRKIDCDKGSAMRFAIAGATTSQQYWQATTDAAFLLLTVSYVDKL